MINWRDIFGRNGGEQKLPPGLVFATAWIVAVVFLGLSTAVYFQYQGQIRLIEADTSAELTAITDFKSRELSRWVMERKNNLLLFAEEPQNMAMAQSLLISGETASGGIRKQTGRIGAIAGFNSLCLVRVNGIHALKGDKCPHAEGILTKAGIKSLKEGKVALLDFHRNGAGKIHLDLIAPVAGEDGKTIGAWVGSILPEEYLYTFIQSWPVPKRTAEILLVKREGDGVVYLNDLRFRPGAALNLRIPVTQDKLPAAVAVKGGRGFMNGIDYRGEPVMAAYGEVRGTPWHMVAKQDRAEILEPIKRIMSFWITVLFILLVIGATTVFIFWRRSMAESLIRGEFAEKEREMLAVRLDFLSRYTNDVLLIADGNYKIIDANQRAIQMYGYGREELIGMSAQDLRSTETAGNLGTDLSNPTGTIYKTLARRKDGTVFPVEVSYSRFEVRGRIYIAAIIRDISERQKAETALRESESRFRSLFDHMNEGVALHSLVRDNAGLVVNYRVVEVNNRYTTILSVDRDKVEGKLATEVYGTVEPPFLDAFARPALTGIPAEMELFFEPMRKHFHVSVAPWGPDGFATIFTDITSKKMAETALMESERRFRGAMETARAVAIQVDRDGRVTFANEALLKLLGCTLDEVVGTVWADKYCPPDDRDKLLPLFVEGIRTGKLPEDMPNPIEFKVKSKDGELRIVRWSISMNTHSDGAVTGMSAFGEDITERKKAEDALVVSSSLLNSSLEATADGILVVDLKGRVSKYNQRFAEMWRIPGDVLESNLDELMLANVVSQVEEPELFLARVNELYAHPEETSFDLIRLKGGRIFERYSQSQRIGNEIVGRVWSFRDVTERKNAEEELVVSNSLLNSSLEATADGILVVDLKGDVIKYNRKLGDMWGIPSDMMGSSDTATLMAQVGRQLANPELFMKRVNDLYALPMESSFDRIDLKDGRVYERYSHPQMIGERIVGRVWSFRDITLRLGVEAALRESEEGFRRIFEEAVVGICIVGLDGRFIKVNPAFRSFVGYSEAELTKIAFPEITHPDHREQDRVEIGRLVKGEINRYVTSKRYIRKDGSVVWGHAAVSVMRNADGKPMYFIPLIDDITSLHKAEEEMLRLSRLESLSVLAGGVAHDFNNLLTAIMGNLSLVQADSELAAKTRIRLTAAENASLRARDLTQQLLTFSRGGAPERKPTCLNGIIREAAEFTIHGSKVRCDLRLPDDLWAVNADDSQISQVISNLVINAVHAMPEGGVVEIAASNEVVTVESNPSLNPGRYVLFWVKDSGVGISPDHLAKIYDPYFTTKKKGSGLGLATSYSVVRHHDGLIEAESAPGKGTTFKVYLPALPDSVIPATNTDDAVIYGKGRILLMDDEQMVRNIGSAMLESLGYEVESFPEGGVAVEAYKKAMEVGRPFAAVILDLTIPAGMGGIETMEKLRALDPLVHSVVSSGYSADMVLGDYRSRGFNEILPKPYRLKDMAAVLARLLA